MNKKEKIPFEMAMEYAKGNGEKMAAWEDGFVAGISYQIQKSIKPLSFSEIQKLYPSTEGVHDFVDIVRAIEKAHRIINDK